MAIQFKRAAASVRTNYTPSEGELYIVDVGSSNPSIYIGDGSTAGGKLASAREFNSFSKITISGQTDVIADSTADSLTLVAGSNISLTTNETNDAITIANTYSAPAETDPIFTAHTAYTITNTNLTNWNTAYNWGNHSIQNYMVKSSSAIDELIDVDTSTTAPLNNQVLAWQTDKWVPQTFAGAGTIAGLTDTTISNPSNGKILEYYNGSWILGDKGGGAGSSTFISLSDTPSNFSNQANKFVKVNSNATGLLFTDITANSPLSWNNLTSTLSFSATTDIITEGSTNLYYTDARVDTILGTKDYIQDADFSTSGIMKRGASAGDYSVITDNSTNWNTAYSWGDHSSAGYLTSISTLTSIGDVTVSNPSNDQVLQWNGSKWINSTFTATSTSFVALTDTPSIYGTAGQILSSTGAGTAWVDALQATTFVSLIDTPANLGNVNQVLTSTGTGTQWATPTAVPTNITDLSDVPAYGSSGQVLSSTGSSTQWTDVSLTLQGLTDTPGNYGTSGQVLSSTGTGTQWVNQISGSGIGLNDLSIGNEPSASGNGQLTYDNTTGVFTYTPPVIPADISDLTDSTNLLFSGSWASITGKPTTIAGYGITDAFSGNYNDLTNKPSIPSALTDLGISDGQNEQYLKTDGAGNFTFSPITISRNDTIYYTNGNFGQGTDSRNGKYILRGTTSNSTATEIFIGATSNLRIDFQNNSFNTVEVLVTGTKTGTMGGASFRLEACFQNSSGILSIIGTVNKTKLGSTTAVYDAILDIDTATNKMRLRVKGNSGHNMRWMAVVNTVEVTQ